MLSSQSRRYCESLSSLFDECKIAWSGRWLSDQPNWLGSWVHPGAAIFYNHLSRLSKSFGCSKIESTFSNCGVKIRNSLTATVRYFASIRKFRSLNWASGLVPVWEFLMSCKTGGTDCLWAFCIRFFLSFDEIDFVCTVVPVSANDLGIVLDSSKFSDK